MAHTHPVVDTDTHFKIDGATRAVKNSTDTKSMLVQYDHKSERFTFEVPRFVDEHDLSLCNRVRVHYINIDKNRRMENKAFSEVTDLEVCPEDDNLVTCSWLVPKSATLLAGTMHFVVEFACVEDEEVLYSWNTAKHTNVTIAEGIDGGEAVVNDNIDILKAWENELKANQIVKMEQTTVSTEDNGDNVWTATFGDGKTQELKVKNGSRGATGLVGAIETIGGTRLNFFVGTKAEYDELTEAQRNGLFAIITDDSSKEDINDSLNNCARKDVFAQSNQDGLLRKEDYTRWEKLRTSFGTPPEPREALGTDVNSLGYYYMEVVKYSGATKSTIQRTYPLGIVLWQGYYTEVYYANDKRMWINTTGAINFETPDTGTYGVRVRFINAFGY